MARPDEVPAPRAGEDAEHGSTAALQQLMSAAPDQDPIDEMLGGGELGGGTEDAFFGGIEDEELGPEDDLNDGLDPVLLAPSQRPEEPLTAGAPFGPGPSLVPRPFETEREFMGRVANELRQSPHSNPTLRNLADRIERGE